MTVLSSVMVSLAVVGMMAGGGQSADRAGRELTYGQSNEMFVGAFDRKQAATAGNKVLIDGAYEVLIDGRTKEEIARVPRPDRGSDVVQPMNVVYGNCGSSYFFLYDDGANNDVMEFSTGFDVDGNASDFDWYVDISGPSGYGAFWTDSGPKFPSGSWDSGRISEYTGRNGNHTGVVRTTSRAYLTDGRICFSGGPGDTEYIS